jgi:3-deoxy-D-manno-octulosonic-acid transferase
MLGIPQEAKVIVAGSTYQEDEGNLVDAFALVRRAERPLVMIVAPRQIARSADVLARMASQSLNVQLRSSGAQAADIIVLDTLGELAEVYGIADVAYIGGTTGEGYGHNPLEPIFQGAPITLGPSYSAQRHLVNWLVAHEAATVCHDFDSLAQAWERAFQESGRRDRIGEIAADLTAQRRAELDLLMQAWFGVKPK